MLGAITLTAAIMWQIISAFCIGAVAILAYMRWDTRRENRRRHANKIANELRNIGLTFIPEVLENYGVGDLSGVAANLANAYSIFADDEQRREVVAKIRTKLLKAALAIPEDRAKVMEIIAEATAAREPNPQTLPKTP